MSEEDDCIEKLDEKRISDLKRIFFGDEVMPRRVFKVFTEIPTNERYIVNMITGDHLTLEDACVLLNKQDQRIRELEQELFTEKVKRFEDNLAEYGDLNDKEAWQRKFGMRRREANKKAGIIDWELIPED